jgi:hypothetical protein
MRLLLVAAAAAALAAVGAGAARAATETFSIFWAAPLYAGEFAETGYDSICQPTSGVVAGISSGVGYATVALIDTSGGWRRSARSSVSPVAVYVEPDTATQAATWRKKALCKNSSGIGVSLWMRCARWYWYGAGSCV